MLAQILHDIAEAAVDREVAPDRMVALDPAVVNIVPAHGAGRAQHHCGKQIPDHDLLPPCPCAALPQQLGASLAHSAIERSEEHTSELQSLMRISSAVLCLKKTNTH